MDPRYLAELSSTGSTKLTRYSLSEVKVYQILICCRYGALCQGVRISLFSRRSRKAQYCQSVVMKAILQHGRIVVDYQRRAFSFPFNVDFGNVLASKRNTTVT
jgi:hypothetical protein